MVIIALHIKHVTFQALITKKEGFHHFQLLVTVSLNWEDKEPSGRDAAPEGFMLIQDKCLARTFQYV